MIKHTMKKIIRHLLIPLLTISLVRPVLAEFRNSDRELDLGDQYKRAAGELESWFKKDFVEAEKDSDTQRPDLGYYFDNITFKDAYELEYDGNTGVMVSGSRSWNQDPVLQRDDIITVIDGIAVKHRSHFEAIMSETNVGDTVTLEYIRHGLKNTRRIPVLDRQSTWDDSWAETAGDKKSRGLGGAAYKAMFIQYDNTEMNDLFTSLGFDELSNLSGLHHGFDLQFLIGNGYFLGGYGVWAREKQSVSTIIDQTVPVNRNLKYNSGYGGVSLDKRCRLSDKWILSAGVMLGGGNTRFSIDQIENDIDWNLIDPETSGTYNDRVNLQKKYLLCQPRLSVMYRVLPVFWLRFEAGYSISYSKNGWQQIINENKYDIEEPSQGSSLNGLTISISPWFGF